MLKFGFGDVLSTHCMCGFSAGACATFLVSLIHIARVKRFNAKQGQYNWIWEFAFKTLKNHGIFIFHNGLATLWDLEHGAWLCLHLLKVWKELFYKICKGLRILNIRTKLDK
ncbi:unnamed protein product [Blepharisma stoltei]|uniref:Transmembrane protein n=1 Tax=Blepharisma stoltei TaxID=1481888 RepID=A0AAU9JQG7_9CILI|nr:unnamed protein product [Blepharisma stoltei]